MKKGLVLLISSGIFLTSSCISSTNNSKNRGKSKENILTEYEFFPNDAGYRSADIVSVDTFAFHNTVGLRLERAISSEELATIEGGHYIYEGTPEEKCLIVINDFISMTKANERLTTQRSRVNKNCKSDYIPIPNFWNIKFRDNGTKSHLSPKSKLFISVLKYGLFTKRIDPDKSSMPSKMRHGEVGGIIVNENNTRAIYFVQKW